MTKDLREHRVVELVAINAVHHLVDGFAGDGDAFTDPALLIGNPKTARPRAVLGIFLHRFKTDRVSSDGGELASNHVREVGVVDHHETTHTGPCFLMLVSVKLEGVASGGNDVEDITRGGRDAGQIEKVIDHHHVTT